MLTPYEQGFMTKLAQLGMVRSMLGSAHKLHSLHNAATGELFHATNMPGAVKQTSELAEMAHKGLRAANKYLPAARSVAQKSVVSKVAPKVSSGLRFMKQLGPYAGSLAMIQGGANIIGKNPETGERTFQGMMGANQAANARQYTKGMFNGPEWRQSLQGAGKGVFNTMGSINAAANLGLGAAQAGMRAGQQRKFVNTKKGWDSFRGAQKWYEHKGYTPAQARAKARPQRPYTGNLASTPWWAKRMW